MQRVASGTIQHNNPKWGLYETIERLGKVKQIPVESPSTHSSSLLAQRYELKYRVSESTAIAVRSYIQSYLQQDKYAAQSPTGQYAICSLYLDSQRFDLFHETVLDKCNRFKLRIRGYDDDPNTPIFFEIKRKLNRIIYKSRAKASKDQLAPILNSYNVPLTLPDKDRRTLSQFIHYAQCLQARPMVLIRYMREAYENTSSAKVRITFDRQLCYQSVNQPVFTMNGPGWKPIPINFVVLEIKFTASFPWWLKDMVRMFNLNRQSMSKYCSSVQPLVPRGADIYTIPKR